MEELYSLNVPGNYALKRIIRSETSLVVVAHASEMFAKAQTGFCIFQLMMERL